MNFPWGNERSTTEPYVRSQFNDRDVAVRVAQRLREDGEDATVRDPVWHNGLLWYPVVVDPL